MDILGHGVVAARRNRRRSRRRRIGVRVPVRAAGRHLRRHAGGVPEHDRAVRAGPRQAELLTASRRRPRSSGRSPLWATELCTAVRATSGRPRCGRSCSIPTSSCRAVRQHAAKAPVPRWSLEAVRLSDAKSGRTSSTSVQTASRIRRQHSGRERQANANLVPFSSMAPTCDRPGLRSAQPALASASCASRTGAASRWARVGDLGWVDRERRVRLLNR